MPTNQETGGLQKGDDTGVSQRIRKRIVITSDEDSEMEVVSENDQQCDAWAGGAMTQKQHDAEAGGAAQKVASKKRGRESGVSAATTAVPDGVQDVERFQRLQLSLSFQMVLLLRKGLELLQEANAIIARGLDPATVDARVHISDSWDAIVNKTAKNSVIEVDESD